MRILRLLDAHIEAALMILLLAVASVVVFAQVVMRYVFEASLSWSEELARYLFIWLIYLGISYCARHHRHIKVDLLLHVPFLSLTDKKVLLIFADVVFLGFATVIVWLGMDYTATLFERGQKTASLFDLPIWVIYAAIPVGYGLCAVRLVQNLYLRIAHFDDDARFVDEETNI